VKASLDVCSSFLLFQSKTRKRLKTKTPQLRFFCSSYFYVSEQEIIEIHRRISFSSLCIRLHTFQLEMLHRRLLLQSICLYHLIDRLQEFGHETRNQWMNNEITRVSPFPFRWWTPYPTNTSIWPILSQILESSISGHFFVNPFVNPIFFKNRWYHRSKIMITRYYRSLLFMILPYYQRLFS
jgi:hypothetical protein